MFSYCRVLNKSYPRNQIIPQSQMVAGLLILRRNINNCHGLLMEARGCAILRVPGVAFVLRSECCSVEAGGIQPFDKFTLSFVPGAESGEVARECYCLSAISGTLAQVEQ